MEDNKMVLPKNVFNQFKVSFLFTDTKYCRRSFFYLLFICIKRSFPVMYRYETFPRHPIFMSCNNTFFKTCSRKALSICQYAKKDNQSTLMMIVMFYTRIPIIFVRVSPITLIKTNSQFIHTRPPLFFNKW